MKLWNACVASRCSCLFDVISWLIPFHTHPPRARARTQVKNAKLGNGPFERKREVLADSPYPLTKAVARSPAWDPAALRARHRAVLEHAARVWGL